MSGRELDDARRELIDWLVIVVGAVALLAGFVALIGSLYTTDRDTAVGWGDAGHELRRWQLVVLLVAFAALVVSNIVGSPRMRRVSSLLALGISLIGFVAWWWGTVDELLGQTYISTGHLALGGGMVFTGFALGLQIVVGVLMFMAARMAEIDRQMSGTGVPSRR